MLADRYGFAQAESTAMAPEEVSAQFAPSAGRALWLRMSYAAPPQAPVLSVGGDVDAATSPQLAELLWTRLQSATPALVLDLSEVGFLGLDGVHLLAAAEHYARYRGIALRLVTRTRAVDRALQVGGLTGTLPRFATPAAARAEKPPAVARAVPTPRTPSQSHR